MTVSYEWCIGISDPETDDLSVDFESDATLAMSAYRAAVAAGEKVTLELVRNQGTEVDGLTNRSWAQFDPDTNTLPEYTNYGAGEEVHKVPKRFHAQIATLCP